MTLGPLEAFSVEQLAAVYDANVLSTQRVNQAALPHLREQRDGLLVWVGSSSARGGTPPYLGPYFAAKAAEDALAVSYAAEVSRFGIDSTIIVPGSFTSGTNHYAHAGHPADTAVSDAYEKDAPGQMEDLLGAQAKLSPADADPQEVARQIVQVIGLPKGERPFRVYIDRRRTGPRKCSGSATGSGPSSTVRSATKGCSSRPRENQFHLLTESSRAMTQQQPSSWVIPREHSSVHSTHPVVRGSGERADGSRHEGLGAAIGEPAMMHVVPESTTPLTRSWPGAGASRQIAQLPSRFSASAVGEPKRWAVTAIACSCRKVSISIRPASSTGWA